jgi:hypothetical protein
MHILLSTVALSFRLGSIEVLLWCSGIEKEKFVMGVTQRIPKLPVILQLLFQRNSAPTFTAGALAAACRRHSLS